MFDQGLWSEKLFQETVGLVLAFIFVVGIGIFILRKKNLHLTAAWASFKSWLFAAPALLFFLGLSDPWPTVFLTLVSVAAAKIFFQFTGMYHRTNFVWLTYLGIIALGFLIYENNYNLYLGMPMILLALTCLIPIWRNSYKRMIQYIALTLLNFSFLWGFLHLGLVIKLDGGAFMLIYIIILTEVCDNLYLGFSRFFNKMKIASKITPKRSFEGFIAALVLTLLLAWGMRHLLPVRTEPYWIASGLIAVFFGSLGDVTMAVIRRDLGIKDTGAFILGRSDFLSRLDRLIFVAPIFYLVMSYFQRVGL